MRNDGFITVLLGAAIVLGVFLFFLIIGAGFSAVSGFIFMLLWNYALVVAFPNLPVLSFWVSWGIWILISMVGATFRAITRVKGNKENYDN